MNVPGKNNIVIAAIVIIDAESRWVCSATLQDVSKDKLAKVVVPRLQDEHAFAVDDAISVFVRDSR
jgi:hypothetical protein